MKHNTKIAFAIIITVLNLSLAFSQEKQKLIVLNPVLITDSTVKKIPFVKTNILKAQLQNEPIRDIGDYMRTIPNVAGLRKGGIAIDPVVRGFKFSQLNVVLDNGIKIENGCPNRMDPVSSHIEAEDIEKLEIIKGPYALKYGLSLGGTINIISDKPHPYEKFEIHANALYGFETNWNGQKEHLSVYGGNKKLYFLASGGYKDYGNYESGRINGRDTTFNSSFKKYNYSAKIGYSPKDNHSIIISYSKVHSQNVLYPALPMDEKKDNTHILSLDYNVKYLSEIVKNIDIKVYQSNVDHVMDNSNRSNWSTKQMIADVSAINTGGRIESNLQFKKNKLNTGLDFENIYKDGTRDMTMIMMGTTSFSKTNLWYKSLVQNTGLFAEYNTSLNSWDFNAVIRCDYNKATSDDTLKIIKNNINYFNDLNSNYFNINANIGVIKQINEWLNASLVIGRGMRSPNILERFIKLMAVGYDNYDYLGNPQLKPEINNEIDLTLKFLEENIGSMYLSGFYSYVQDFITAERIPPSVVTPKTQGVLGVKQFVNTDFATFNGFEFGYNSPDKYKLGGNIIASYTYATVNKAKKYIITGAQVTGETEVSNDAISEIPPFETTMNVYYKFFHGNLIPKITFRAVANQNHTSSAMYESHTPGFGIFNVSLRYKVNKFAEVKAGFNNVFNRAYYEHLNRKILGSNGKLYEPGRVFFITIYANI